MSTTGGKAAAAKVIDLAQVSPPRLFFALLHQRFTGVVQLEQPGPVAGSRAIWFAGGMPVFTDWAVQTEVLGQVLVEQGAVDEATLMSALGAMAQNGGLLGQTLLQMGAIDEAALSNGLRLQCGRKLVGVFGLRESPATLTPCDHALKEMAPVNVLELILTAAGKHYDEERVRSEMGPALDGELRATAAYERYKDHFRFRPTDEQLLGALLSGTTMDQMAALPGASRQRAAQLVYVLWACQMLRVGAAASKAPATKQQPVPGKMRQTPRATPQVTPPVASTQARKTPRPPTGRRPSAGPGRTSARRPRRRDARGPGRHAGHPPRRSSAAPRRSPGPNARPGT